MIIDSTTTLPMQLIYSVNAVLTHLFLVQSFSTLLTGDSKVVWCFQGVEKGCIRNKRVKGT